MLKYLFLISFLPIEISECFSCFHLITGCLLKHEMYTRVVLVHYTVGKWYESVYDSSIATLYFRKSIVFTFLICYFFLHIFPNTLFHEIKHNFYFWKHRVFKSKAEIKDALDNIKSYLINYKVDIKKLFTSEIFPLRFQYRRNNSLVIVRIS